MQLVVDANILFSALIKDAKTRKLMANKQVELFAPEFIKEELSKYDSEIMKKANLSGADFEKSKRALIDLITTVELDIYMPFLEEAKKTIFDEKDSPYLALCIAKKIPLWSNDKELKKQKIVMVYNTMEIELLL